MGIRKTHALLIFSDSKLPINSYSFSRSLKMAEDLIDDRPWSVHNPSRWVTNVMRDPSMTYRTRRLLRLHVWRRLIVRDDPIVPQYTSPLPQPFERGITMPRSQCSNTVLEKHLKRILVRFPLKVDWKSNPSNNSETLVWNTGLKPLAFGANMSMKLAFDRLLLKNTSWRTPIPAQLSTAAIITMTKPEDHPRMPRIRPASCEQVVADL